MGCQHKSLKSELFCLFWLPWTCMKFRLRNSAIASVCRVFCHGGLTLCYQLLYRNKAALAVLKWISVLLHNPKMIIYILKNKFVYTAERYMPRQVQHTPLPIVYGKCVCGISESVQTKWNYAFFDVAYFVKKEEALFFIRHPPLFHST